MEKNTKITADYPESFWDFLASVKLSVLILLSLAMLSVIGTIIPQKESPGFNLNFLFNLTVDMVERFSLDQIPETLIDTMVRYTFIILELLDVFDMYHSWWFQGLLALLVINIIICSIDRLLVTGKIIFTRHPQFNLEGYRRRKSRKDFDVKGDTDSVRDDYVKVLTKKFRYCKVVSADRGFAITAEKGRWTRLGVYGVHLSLVVLLAGSMLGSLTGFEGFVEINEGESADTIILPLEEEKIKLPFSIRCDDFNIQFYEDGRRPKEYRSKLTIIENGQTVVQKEIIVNDPLRYKGINIYQHRWGEAPAADMPETIEMAFKSKASGMIYSLKAKLHQAVEIPEGMGQFVLEGFDADGKFRGRPVGPAFVGKLTPKSGKPQAVMLPMKFPKFDNMRGGKMVISVAPVDMPMEKRYYTGLQVTRDPGVNLVYTGFILMILGFIVTFFMSHKQVVVEVQPKGNNIAVMVSGKANKNKVGFEHQIDRLADELNALPSHNT